MEFEPVTEGVESTLRPLYIPRRPRKLTWRIASWADYRGEYQNTCIPLANVGVYYLSEENLIVCGECSYAWKDDTAYSMPCHRSYAQQKEGGCSTVHKLGLNIHQDLDPNEISLEANDPADETPKTGSIEMTRSKSTGSEIFGPIPPTKWEDRKNRMSSFKSCMDTYTPFGIQVLTYMGHYMKKQMMRCYRCTYISAMLPLHKILQDHALSSPSCESAKYKSTPDKKFELMFKDLTKRLLSFKVSKGITGKTALEGSCAGLKAIDSLHVGCQYCHMRMKPLRRGYRKSLLTLHVEHEERENAKCQYIRSLAKMLEDETGMEATPQQIVVSIFQGWTDDIRETDVSEPKTKEETGVEAYAKGQLGQFARRLGHSDEAIKEAALRNYARKGEFPPSHRTLLQILTSQEKHVTEDQNMDDNANLTECIICVCEPVTHAFVQCGHLCCCGSCAAQVAKCPLCRIPVKAMMRVYLPGRST